MQAAQQVSHAVKAVLTCTDSAAWAPALAAADILYRLHPAVSLEATLTAFARDLGSEHTVRSSPHGSFRAGISIPGCLAFLPCLPSCREAAVMFTRHRALCICAGTSGMCCSIEACCWVYKQTSPALYRSTQGEPVWFSQSCNISCYRIAILKDQKGCR